MVGGRWWEGGGRGRGWKGRRRWWGRGGGGRGLEVLWRCERGLGGGGGGGVKRWVGRRGHFFLRWVLGLRVIGVEVEEDGDRGGVYRGWEPRACV